MRIALDIRRAGDFGIGTYLRKILAQLSRLDCENDYLLIGEQRHLDEIGALSENFRLLKYPAEPGSLRTHLHLPLLLENHKIDLLHMPWFYAPAMVPCRLIITVHDLTEIAAPRVGASPAVQIARLWFARRALDRADRILAVSESARHELERGFRVLVDFPHVGGPKVARSQCHLAPVSASETGGWSEANVPALR